MKKLTLLLLLVLSIFFLSFDKVIAETLDSNCTNKEKLRLRELVANTQIIYEIKDALNEAGLSFKTYEITITGFNSDFYIENPDMGIYFEYKGSSIVKTSGFDPGSTYQFPFYASKSNICSGYKILTKTIVLPPYNKYSEDPLCVGNEEYELCKPNSPIKIDSYEDFLLRVKEYIKKKKISDDEPQPSTNKSVENWWDGLFNFWWTYYMYILLSIIILGIAIIIVIELKKRRSLL